MRAQKINFTKDDVKLKKKRATIKNEQNAAKRNYSPKRAKKSPLSGEITLPPKDKLSHVDNLPMEDRVDDFGQQAALHSPTL